MSILMDVFEHLPVDDRLKFGAGILVALGGIAGFVFVPNLGGSPYIGKEVKTVGHVGVSGTKISAKAYRKAHGQELGFRKFNLKAGQTLTLNYDLDTTCGGIRIKVDRAGVNSRDKLGPKLRLDHDVTKSGQGTVKWTAPEDGGYKVSSFPKNVQRCDTSWTLSWKADRGV